jgi:mannose-6-phosphate isomerase-like protein (cupin superfamily)
MKKTGKVWGVTRTLLDTPLFHQEWMEIKPMHRCSWHMHRQKFNSFVVISGQLMIEVRKSYGLVDVTTLNAGEFTTVPPGEWHRFKTGGQACIAIEQYYLAALSEDIEREDCGGLVE